MKNIYKDMIMKDLNPFLLFDSDGKLVDYNTSAEFLLNDITIEELYSLALTYASKSYGINNQYVELKYPNDSYYAVSIGYIDDMNIALRLFKTIEQNQIKDVQGDKSIYQTEDFKDVNLFSLIDISKSSTLLQSNLKIIEDYDISIPEIKLKINSFILLLNSCFSHFKDHELLTIIIRIKLGEYQMIDNKRHGIISCELQSNQDIDTNSLVEQKAIDANVNLFSTKKSLILEFPMFIA
ncbi:MAG: hypothetical protein ISR68_03090 [Campylobacterales bacterium]|nr:hypothetical protein [Campylobacterales bacterium]